MSESNDNKLSVLENADKNVIDLDRARLKKFKMTGHTSSMMEEFEILRLKLLYDKPLEKDEAIKLVTYIKYFMVNGPTEPYRLTCKFLYEKYVEPYGM